MAQRLISQASNPKRPGSIESLLLVTMLSTNCIIQYGSQYLHVTIIKLIKFKLNQKFISLIALATFQVFNNHMWLVAVV